MEYAAMMDAAFLPNNLHLESLQLFRTADPHLRRLAGQKLVFHSPLLRRLPCREAGIYTLGGGRQVGKTTLLKQWMLQLLEDGTIPESIAFLTGELIPDHMALIRTVQGLAAAFPAGQPGFLILDEVTYIREWDKGIKFLADSGALERVILVLTGSDLSFIKEARMRFPGRRGKADVADFHLHPLSFRETLEVKGVLSAAEWKALDGGRAAAPCVEKLFAAFDAYLIHGGYMTAINDMAAKGTILPATFATYSDWVRGDMLKRGKREAPLRELLAALIRRHGGQVTWQSLSAATSLEHHATVADYVELLISMDAMFQLPALAEHKLAAAPKKARKLFFRDPFILHSVHAWLEPARDPYARAAAELASDPERAAALAESVAAAHHARLHETYYIKAEGEVDIAYLENGRIRPVEVKWTSQLRPADLKQIRKYPGGVVLTKQRTPGDLDGLSCVPLPLYLATMPAQPAEAPGAD